MLASSNYCKVKKVEVGNHEYDTVFTDIDGKEVQVPIIKGIYESKGIVGKSIKVVYGNVIEKVEIL